MLFIDILLKLQSESYKYGNVLWRVSKIDINCTICDTLTYILKVLTEKIHHKTTLLLNFISNIIHVFVLFLIKIKASENPFIIHAENTISVQLTIKYLVTTFKRQKPKKS